MIYDLIIIGGGTSGCACAYISAKLGLKTLLIEKNIHLGGAITSGFVVPTMKSNTKDFNCDFFNAFVCEMKSFGAQITYKDANSGWFNPEIAKIVLDKMLNDVGCDVMFDSEVTNISTSNISIINKSEFNKNEHYSHISNSNVGTTKTSSLSNRNMLIKTIEVSSRFLSTHFEAKYFVDATGDALFSKILNHDFLDNENLSQALTLRFLISGIDLEKFKNWITNIDKNETVTNYCYTNDELHLTTAYTWDNKDWGLRPIFDDAVKNNDLKLSDTAYFQLFTVAGMPGTVSLNCPRIISETLLNIFEPMDYSNALRLGRQQVWRIFNFCKKYFIGFENAFISNIADSLGVRESLRAKGEEVFSELNITNPKNISEIACWSDYPIDIHSNKQNSSTLDFVKQPYALPMSSLRSANYKNLYIIGRCLSATFRAQAAIRTQLCCFSMGEAVAKEVKNKIDCLK